MRPPDKRMMSLVRWIFTTRADRQFDRRLAEYKHQVDFAESVVSSGYTPVLRHFPPSNQVIEVVRQEWPGPKFIRMDEQAPEFNVYGLWWRHP